LEVGAHKYAATIIQRVTFVPSVGLTRQKEVTGEFNLVRVDGDSKFLMSARAGWNGSQETLTWWKKHVIMRSAWHWTRVLLAHEHWHWVSGSTFVRTRGVGVRHFFFFLPSFRSWPGTDGRPRVRVVRHTLSQRFV
jgi:hypothetical protein